MDKTKDKTFQIICQTVQNIATEPEELFIFAYELRKFDKENKFTQAILTQNVHPESFIPLICSNEWNQVTQLM